MEVKLPQKAPLLRIADEDWAEVKDFPMYLISTYGRVYSSRSNIQLKASVIGSGYLHVILSLNNIVYGRLVHRLVAEAFVPGWADGLEVNHIDGHKLNNYVDNLEWVTPLENIRHAYAIGLKK